MVDEQKKGPAGADLIEELNEDFDTFESWAVENWRIIAAICVGIVVLVAAIGIGVGVSKMISKKTAQAFASADTQDKLLEVLKNHPGAAAAPDARMKLAMLQAEKKDYSAAIANFKEVADSKYANDTLRFRALLNSAYSLEIQAKIDEAIAAFSSVGQNIVASDEIRYEANYGAGRLYAGKREFDKAKSFLSKATSVRPNNMGEFFWSSQAKSLLDRLPASAPASQKSAAPVSAPDAKPKG